MSSALIARSRLDDALPLDRRARSLAPPPRTSKRMYAGAQANRLTSSWMAAGTSADSEILTSLRALRNRSRQLVRDNEHAKNAVRIVKNNVIGEGIGMQAQVVNARGKLITKANDQIEEAYTEWSDKNTCHTAGKLGMPEMERVIFDQLVTAGEVLVRKIRKPFGGGRIPFALEIIEADRLADQWQSAKAPNGNQIRMGVEVDEWYRPVAYWLWPTHPGDYQFSTFVPSQFIRVPADEIEHLYLIDRWPQTRGEPWFHATLTRLHNMSGYEEAEIVAARSSASIVGFFKGPEPVAADAVEDGRRVVDVEPGTFQTLLPGEDFVGFNPSRPNAALEPFMRYMLRCLAAGVGVSYESLSRDYSQSNYSSSRLALLDDRDLWRVLQGWFIRNFRWRIHREWMDAAVLSGVLTFPDYYTNAKKYQAVRFKPRGWSWIDPTREVAAYKVAVRNGFMTQADVIAQTAGGADIEDILQGRRRELDMAAELNLVFDSDPSQVNDKGQAQGAAVPGESDTDAPASGDNPSDVEPESEIADAAQ